jgi:hypothetical protein
MLLLTVNGVEMRTTKIAGDPGKWHMKKTTKKKDPGKWSMKKTIKKIPQTKKANSYQSMGTSASDINKQKKSALARIGRPEPTTLSKTLAKVKAAERTRKLRKQAMRSGKSYTDPTKN